MLDQIPRPQRSGLYLIQIVMHPALLAGMLHGQFVVAQNRAENVVEIVGDAAGQGAYGLHLLGLKQLLFQPFALGDIGKQAVGLEKTSLLVPADAPFEGDMNRGAILTQHLEFYIVGLTMRFELWKAFLKKMSIGRRQQVSEPASHSLFCMIKAQHCQPGPVDGHQTALFIEGLVAHGGIFIKVAKTVFAFTDFLFLESALTDIPANGDHQRTVIALDLGDRILKGQSFAILADQLQFNSGATGFHHFGDGHGGFFQIRAAGNSAISSSP